jgi:parallel beta-helix repeat protein
MNAPLVTQNDAITFVVNVFDDGQPFALDNVETVSFASVRPDRQTVVTPGTKTGTNTVQFDLGTEETRVPGKVEAVVQLYDSEGRVSTISFTYQVLKDPTGDGYIPTANEQTLVETVLNNGPLVIQQAQDAAEYATAQGDYAKSVGDQNKTRWLTPVATFADIATTYPNPQHGDTVMTTNDGKIYRYENGQWNWTQAYTDTAIADAQNKIGILNKKTDGIVSVKEFGAVGDGVADDTTAIQNALNVGGIIYFPAGTYIVSYGLVPKSNTLITGSRNAILKLKDGQNGDVWQKRFIFDIESSSTPIENVTIENITLDGNKDNVTNCYHCIYVGANASKITIRNTYLKNPQYDCVYVGDGAKEVNIIGNFSFNSGRSHYVVTNGSNVNIIDNKGMRAQNTYIDLESNVSGDVVDKIIIRGNVFIADASCVADGIGNTGPGTHKDIIVESNYFYLNRRFGAFAGQGICDGVIIKNNLVYGKTVDASGFIACLDTVRNVFIEGNKLYIDETSTGTGAGIRVQNPENVTIKGNKIFNAKGSGINVDNPALVNSNIKIIENDIISPVSDGIYVNAKNFKVKDNIVKSAGRYGINIYNTQDGDVTGNTVDSSVNYAIYLYTVLRANVDKNTIITPTSTGIYIHSSSKDVAIEGNKIYNSGAEGIILRNSTGLRVINNTIVGSTNQGIYQFSDASYCVIANNMVKNSRSVAIDLSGSYNIVANNRCYDDQGTKTQTYGLWVRSGDYYTIMGNDFRGNLNAGINGSCTNYKPSVSGTFATDIANFNFVS